MENSKYKKINFKKEILKENTQTLGNIFLAGVATIGLVGVALVAGNAIQLLKYILPEDDIKKHYKYRANSSFKKLITKGYIQEKTLDGKKYFVLTDKGKRYYQTIKEKKTKNWNGKWHIISFDVYEKNRSKRDLLRKELHQYGFRMLQKSMWIYPYPCDEYIALLKSDLSFGKNVQYMVVDYIDKHIELKKSFGL